MSDICLMPNKATLGANATRERQDPADIEVHLGEESVFVPPEENSSIPESNDIVVASKGCDEVLMAKFVAQMGNGSLLDAIEFAPRTITGVPTKGR